MSLRAGAEPIVKQCLNVSENERVVLVNDSNDQRFVDAIIEVVSEITDDYEYVQYEEPENHGEEPPERIGEALRSSDVFIAPTTKSISHTEARINANRNGARGATMPGITEEIWRTSLQADYDKVREITEKAFELLEETDTIHITTSTGTDLRIDVDLDYYDKDIGIMHGKGAFGNLPAGEADGASLNARGTLIVDHSPFIPDRNEGAELKIKDNKVVSVKTENAKELSQTIENVDGAKNIAEFGFGTNPKAKLIGNILNDEKVLGTVHIAIGDNSSYIPDEDELQVKSDIHWDFVCESPTVYFDDQKVLDEGRPVFLD